MTNSTSVYGEMFQTFHKGLIMRFGEATYRSWMFDILVEEESEEEVRLSTGSPMRRDRLIERFKPGIHEEWNRVIAPAKKLSIGLRKKNQLSEGAAKAEAKSGVPFLHGDLFNETQPTSAGIAAPQNGAEKEPLKKVLRLDDLASPLDAHSTFETFAVDDTNRLAHAAARQILAEGARNNLVYIHGPSGIGKTHLLHAVGHEWRQRHGAGACAYITHSSLIGGCVNAALSNSSMMLHKDLLSQQVLLIDDIHLLEGKKRTQEEVLNMVNAFIASGRKLVIAGEAAPARLAENNIHARLADRLAGGLAVSMEPGGVALRTDVLKMRGAAAAMTCAIDDEAIEYIAANFPHSMREAIGALNQLMLAYAGEENTTIGRTEAQEALRSRLNGGMRKRKGTLDDAIVSAAENFSITVEDIKGRAQPQYIVKARHAVVYVGRVVLKESFPRIGRALSRDHTTVMSSFRRAEALLERNQDFRDAVDAVTRSVGG